MPASSSIDPPEVLTFGSEEEGVSLGQGAGERGDRHLSRLGWGRGDADRERQLAADLDVAVVGQCRGRSRAGENCHQVPGLGQGGPQYEAERAGADYRHVCGAPRRRGRILGLVPQRAGGLHAPGPSGP